MRAFICRCREVYTNTHQFQALGEHQWPLPHGGTLPEGV